MSKQFFAIMMAVCLSFGAAAQAGVVTISAEELSDRWVLTGNGSIDFADGDFSFSTPIPRDPPVAQHSASGSTRIVEALYSDSILNALDASNPITGPILPFGDVSVAMTATGDTFGLHVDVPDDRYWVFLPQGYQSGDELNFVWTLLKTDLGGAMLQEGIIASWDNNSVVVVNTTIPLPGALPLFAAGLGILALRKKQSA
ncbi:MAG: hypothetical protein AAF608_07480 [Pseudomonadota bacterium]